MTLEAEILRMAAVAPSNRDLSGVDVALLRSRLDANTAGIGSDGCWEWTGTRDERSGYGRIRVTSGGSSWKARVHQVAWFLETGQWPKLHVLHRCDNPPCRRYDHLVEGTVAANARDKKEKGRARSSDRNGELNTAAKLTWPQVVEIRTRLASGEVGRRLAEEFAVAPMTISRIGSGQSWRYAPADWAQQLEVAW